MRRATSLRIHGICTTNYNPFLHGDGAKGTKRSTKGTSQGTKGTKGTESELSPEARARVMRDNALDVELYEHAQRLIERRMREYGLQPWAAGATARSVARSSEGSTPSGNQRTFEEQCKLEFNESMSESMAPPPGQGPRSQRARRRHQRATLGMWMERAEYEAKWAESHPGQRIEQGAHSCRHAVPLQGD